MQDVITIGRRLVPIEQIALVEPFDPASNPEFKPEKPFKGRVVLINRDTILTETPPQEFAEAYGFRLLAEDNMAANPAVAFLVESFAPTETFRPDKPFETRLKWRDPDRQRTEQAALDQARGGYRRGATWRKSPDTQRHPEATVENQVHLGNFGKSCVSNSR